MANYVEHTSRRLSVDALTGVDQVSFATANTPAYSDWDTGGVDFDFVPGVTGCTVTNNSSEKDVTDLGSKGYRKMLQETVQLSLAVVIQFQLDDTADTLDTAHQVLATAAQAKGIGNLVWVRYDFPNAANTAANNATDTNEPTGGRVAVFAANVTGGDLGIGGGGTNGGFEESAYTLKSWGEVYQLTAV